MSKKNLNWKAYWRIMSANDRSPITSGYPEMKREEMSNWFSCNEEMRWRFTRTNEDYLLS